MLWKNIFVQGQLGNPVGGDTPNKKFYDPRVWLRHGEESFVMLKLVFVWLIFFSSALAQVGEVETSTGGQLIRQGATLDLVNEMDLMEGDRLLSTGNTSLLIYPSTQIHITSQSEITIDQAKMSEDLIDLTINLVRGFMKVLVEKQENLTQRQRYKTRDVMFGVRGTEFELDATTEDVELDVVEGEVEATVAAGGESAQRIKSGEGLRFNRRSRRFARREFRTKMKSLRSPEGREKMQQRWQQKKERILNRRANMRQGLRKEVERKAPRPGKSRRSR